MKLPLLKSPLVVAVATTFLFAAVPDVEAQFITLMELDFEGFDGSGDGDVVGEGPGGQAILKDNASVQAGAGLDGSAGYVLAGPPKFELRDGPEGLDFPGLGDTQVFGGGQDYHMEFDFRVLDPGTTNKGALFNADTSVLIWGDVTGACAGAEFACPIGPEGPQDGAINVFWIDDTLFADFWWVGNLAVGGISPGDGNSPGRKSWRDSV